MIFSITHIFIRLLLRDKGVSIRNTISEEEYESTIIGGESFYEGSKLVSSWCLEQKNKTLAIISLIDHCNANNCANLENQNVLKLIEIEKTYELKLTVTSEVFYDDEIFLLCLLFECFRVCIKNERNRLLINSQDRIRRFYHKIGCKTKFLFIEEKFTPGIMNDEPKIIYTYIVKSGKRDLRQLLKKYLLRKVYHK